MNPAVSVEELSQRLGIPFSEEQAAAITAPLVPQVIVAGAGTGKTTVMASRVVWLVATGQVRPEQVLGLTFTRKAAAELDARILRALHRLDEPLQQAGSAADEPGERPRVATYDSFAADLVAEFGALAGMDQRPRMLDDAMRFRLAERVLGEPGVQLQALARLTPSALAVRVMELEAQTRSHLVGLSELRESDAAFAEQLSLAPGYRSKPYKNICDALRIIQERSELIGLVQRYRELKQRLGLTEFADQLEQAVRLASSPEVVRTLRQRYPVVLLDEYQDTSAAQVDLLARIFGAEAVTPGRGGQGSAGHPVTAVGDPLQAIYGWRGAAADTMSGFPTRFPLADGRPALHHELSINRRSGSAILTAANLVSAELRSASAEIAALRPPEGSPPGQVRVARLLSWPEEVAWIGEQAVRAHREGWAASWSQIAVLVRRNSQIAALYQGLVERDVPVEIVGLGGLLQVPEVVHLVSMLRILADPGADSAVATVLTGQRWRFGPRDVLALSQRARELNRALFPERPGQRTGEAPAPLLETLTTRVQPPVRAVEPCLLDAVRDPGDAVDEQARSGLAELNAEIVDLAGQLGLPLPDLVRRVIRRIGLDVELAARGRPAGAAQVAAFVAAVDDFAGVEAEAGVQALLGYLDAELDQGSGMDQAVPSADDSVKLLTVHRAKGLEWDVVILPGLSEDVFPDLRVNQNWVRSAATLPYRLRGDRAAIPQLAVADHPGLVRYGEALADQQRAAEDRLGYVALTRARHHLVATTSHWRGTSTACQPSPYWLACQQVAAASGGVEVDQAEPGPVNPLLSLAQAVPWPDRLDAERLSMLQQAADLVRSAPADADRAEWEDPALSSEDRRLVRGWQRELDLLVDQARRPVLPAGVPSSLAASTLMHAWRDEQAFQDELRRPMPMPPAGAASRLGVRFHEWLQARSAADQPITLDESELAGQRPPEGVDAASEAALARLQQAFEAGPYAGLTPLGVEIPFVLVLAGQQIRGRIDAVYPGRLPGHYRVVDWKTTPTSPDPMQLAIYRLAWAQLAGVDPGQVEAVFHHVLAGSDELPARLPDKAELVALVEALRRDAG